MVCFRCYQLTGIDSPLITLKTKAERIYSKWSISSSAIDETIRKINMPQKKTVTTYLPAFISISAMISKRLKYSPSDLIFLLLFLCGFGIKPTKNKRKTLNNLLFVGFAIHISGNWITFTDVYFCFRGGNVIVSIVQIQIHIIFFYILQKAFVHKKK